MCNYMKLNGLLHLKNASLNLVLDEMSCIKGPTRGHKGAILLLCARDA